MGMEPEHDSLADRPDDLRGEKWPVEDLDLGWVGVRDFVLSVGEPHTGALPSRAASPLTAVLRLV
jgi:hypothetical protein